MQPEWIFGEGHDIQFNFDMNVEPLGMFGTQFKDSSYYVQPVTVGAGIRVDYFGSPATNMDYIHGYWRCDSLPTSLVASTTPATTHAVTTTPATVTPTNATTPNPVAPHKHQYFMKRYQAILIPIACIVCIVVGGILVTRLSVLIKKHKEGPGQQHEEEELLVDFVAPPDFDGL